MNSWLESVLGLFLYFLPTFIGRNKKNVEEIFIVNLLAAWIPLFWIFILIWAWQQEDKDPV